MNDVLVQLGVGGILVVLVLKMVFDFLKSRGVANGAKIRDAETDDRRKAFWDMRSEVKAVHKVVEREDTDGTPMVYMKRSVVDAIGQNTEAITELSGVMRTVDETMKNVATGQAECRTKVAEALAGRTSP